jgi:hypothetical protein
LPFFVAPYKQKKEKKKKKEKIQKGWKILQENKKIYQEEGYTKMPRKLSKTGWGRSKYTRLENLTMYFRLMKTLLAKKNQFKKKSLKLNV